MFSSVDFPDPEAPTIASDVPCSMVRSTSRNAYTRGSLPNSRLIDRSSTAGNASGSMG